MRTLEDTVESIAERLSVYDRRPTMLHVRRAIGDLKSRFAEPLVALETGTIRSYSEQHESTRHVAEALGDRGRLISVDLSHEAIEISRDICRRQRNVEWVEQDSLSYLASLDEQLHFVLLDSENDTDLIFDEFRLAVPRVVEGGIVMIDDAGVRAIVPGIPRRSVAVKGQRVWTFLHGFGIDHDVLRAPRGHGTQLRVPLDRGNSDRVRQALEGMPPACT